MVGIGGKKEKFGINQMRAQGVYQENRTVHFRGKIEEAGGGLAGMDKKLSLLTGSGRARQYTSQIKGHR
jgi:hypothetical protein